MKFDKIVFLKAIKEPLRLLVLALIAWLLTVVVPQIDVQYIPVITLVLKFFDKWLHEIGKAEKNEKLITGITRF